MSDDEDLNTILAYTKNPKTSKRTTFQDELHKVITARVARQQATEEHEIRDYVNYSDEFDESEDDELLEDGNVGKDVFDNFQLSEDEEEKPHKVSFLKIKNLVDTKDNDGLEYSIEKELSANHGRFESEQMKSPLFTEQQKECKTAMHEEMVTRPVPIPRPRELRTRSTPSVEGTVFTTLDETFKPTPHQRTMLRKSSPIEEKDDAKMEDRVYNIHSSSVSAPSSLTRLNDNISVSEKKMLSESFSSEGLWQSSPPSMAPNSKHIIASTNDISGDSLLTACIEEPFAKELEWQENEGHSDDSKNSGSRSPSVLELMMTTVYEKSMLQENYLDDLADEISETLQYAQTVASKPKQRSEHFIDLPVKGISQDKYEKAKSDQKTITDDSFKNKETVETKNFKNKEDISERAISPSIRSLKSAQGIRKTGVSKSCSVKSRYLGTLMVLDNKQLEKSASDLEEADALRATVYQDWLEKKRIFLQELHKIKRKEEEREKEKKIKDGGAKKEEAIASFKAWKAMKTKELQKSLLKIKEEEDRKQKEMEEITEKREQSKKAFERWRDDKEEIIREKTKKERQAEIKKKRKEQESISEKKKANISAIKKWNERKEDALKQKRKEKLHEKLRQEQERMEREEKEKRALEVYERWLEKKEKREIISKKQKKLQVILEDEPPPPWSPPSRTVPVGK